MIEFLASDVYVKAVENIVMTILTLFMVVLLICGYIWLIRDIWKD